ncbi:MAG: DUF493 domain-containing protein [Pirellulaceae bacterium]|nr:DUF493 domain-containing protein [Planctomycetales bacterium]
MTDREQAIELLNQTHKFPDCVMFKVIGVNANEFVSRIVAAVRHQLQHATDPPFRTRETAGGRHVSITLEPMIQSAEEVLTVYECIQQIDGVVMVM